MAVRWPSAADDDLVTALRAFPAMPPGLDAERLFARAELHGLADCMLDAWGAAGLTLEPRLAQELGARSVARQLDHDAHLRMLHRIDEALAARRIRALVLKGPLFAERFYPRPSARATSDIDLLVEEGSVPAAAEALEGLGYATATGPEEERFRREHHHLHLSHPHALPLELHFHAYRGFGHTLRSEPLIERSRMVSGHEFMTLRVADPADELVYLAVHASAHRFVRLAWLLDVRLLLERMTSDERELARARADAWGYRRALSLCALLVREVLGVSADSLGPIEPIRGLRESLLRAIVGEPGNPVLRSATRFVYTSALCDSWNASARYAVHASRGHAKRLLGFEV